MLRYDALRERIPQFDRALAAARRLEDRCAEGQILNELGVAYSNLGAARHAMLTRLKAGEDLSDA